MISDWHWFLILTNLISDDDSCNSRDLGDISKLKIKPKEKSSKKDEGKQAGEEDGKMNDGEDDDGKKSGGWRWQWWRWEGEDLQR